MCCAELQEVYKHMSVFLLFSPLSFAEQAAMFHTLAARDMEQVQNYAGGILSLWFCGNYFIIQNADLLTDRMK